MNADAVGVDASVAVKWVITAEEHSEQAQALLEDSVAASRPMIAPPHFAGEVANAIYQRLRSTDPNKHIGRDHAEAALIAFAALPAAGIARDDLLSRAFGFAADHDLPSICDGDLNASRHHLRPSYPCETSVRTRQLASSPRRGAGSPGTPSFGRR